MTKPMRIGFTCLLALAAVPALAHPGHGAETIGFFSGLAHPFTGLDHLLAMLAVGLWSATTATTARRIWLAPLSFASMLLVGALLAVNGLAVPAVEPMITASLLVLGLLIMARVRLPEYASMLLVGSFAFFHGAAHGVELGATAALVGIVIATALLHSAGIGAGLLLKARSLWWQRGIGAGIALTGVGLAFNLV